MLDRSFERTIGIDYSGAGTPINRSRKLAIYCADGNAPPQEVLSQQDNLGRWTRREIAEWLVNQLMEEGKPTLVGIDHAFSFPIRYFQEYHELHRRSWDYFLDDFREHWPTDEEDAFVYAIRNSTGQARCGDRRWLRLTDQRTGTAKSVFQFRVQGSVAHSTHAGLPWLRYIRRNLGARVHFWPFAGWDIPEGKSVVAEVYPSLWSRRFEKSRDRTQDQHDAYSVSGWLSYTDQRGQLPEYFNPSLSQEERDIADVEGWILGIMGYIRLDQAHSEMGGGEG